MILSLVLAGCTFDYGQSGTDETGPDIVMRRVEYVRVRDGAPQVRFKADEAERWEKRQTMGLAGLSFEQFEKQGAEIDSQGNAGTAQVYLDSGNIDLSGGVRMEMKSEDLTIETAGLSWHDKDRRLHSGEEDTVDIQRPDGTFFQGRGFSADLRKQTWNFSGSVEGSYVYEEEEDDAAETP
jgi:LPS export ABC transporter protein LptC